MSTVSFSMKFTDYRAAAMWCTAHDFDGAAIKFLDAPNGGVIVTLHGANAIAAIEATTRAKAKLTPRAA